MNLNRQTFFLLLTTVLLVGGLLFALDLFELDRWLLESLLGIQAMGVQGQLLFALLVCLMTLLLLPSVLLTLAAGALYGVLWGSLIIVLSETAGSVMAFASARYLFGVRVRRFLLQKPRLARLVAIPRRDDWWLLALLRTFPFFPFKISNYMLGFTPLSVGYYALGTFIGLWPVALFNVYLGALAGDLLRLQQGATEVQFNPWQYAVGLGFVSLVVLLAVRIAGKRLREPSEG